MKRIMGSLVAACVLSCSVSVAAAEPAQDEAAFAQALGRCFVLKSTGQDRIVAARWIFGSMASSPQVADVANISSETKASLDREMALLFTRLITVDCAAESRPLFLMKSTKGFETAGGALGQIAMTELLTNEQAAAAFSAYTDYLNEEDFEAVTK